MNWYRAKTILIVFFILMNIFLLANLIYSTKKSTVVTPEIISSTINVLARNNIEIDASLIPEKTVSMKSFEMKNSVSDKVGLAKILCGDTAVMVSDNIYSGKNGTMEFIGDRFVFTSSDLCPFNAGDNYETYISELMKNCGIDLSAAQLTTQQDTDSSVLTFINNINEYRIFDSYIKAVISQGGKLHSIEGIWFSEPVSISGRLSLKSITGVLIDFILEPNRPQGKNVITKLELGYTASDTNIYHETTVLLPVWQITLSDGSTYCIDTRE